jgi:hypothetical protein
LTTGRLAVAFWSARLPAIAGDETIRPSIMTGGPKTRREIANPDLDNPRRYVHENLDLRISTKRPDRETRELVTLRRETPAGVSSRNSPHQRNTAIRTKRTKKSATLRLTRPGPTCLCALADKDQRHRRDNHFTSNARAPSNGARKNHISRRMTV